MFFVLVIVLINKVKDILREPCYSVKTKKGKSPMVSRITLQSNPFG